MAKIKKKKTIKEMKYIRIFLAIFSILFVVISLWIILDCFEKYKNEKEFYASYKISSNPTYKVYYNTNEFYDNNYIGMDNKYVSSLINRIEVNFNYQYFISKLANTTYTYDISTTLISDYVNNSKRDTLWSKTEVNIPQTTSDISRSTILDINEPVVIDYNKYNVLATRYKNTLAINTDSYLLVRFNIKIQSKVIDSNNSIEDTRTMEIKIPLVQNVISITKANEDDFNKNIYVNKTLEKEFNYTLFIIAIFVLLLMLPVSVISIARLLVISGTSRYVSLKKKYFKNYGDIIAETSNKPNLKNIEVMEITNFEDLVNIEEELRIPIIFYEVTVDKEAWYLIIDHNKAYRYVLLASSDKGSKIAKKVEKFQE